jgi:hypothetical protein
MPMVSSLAINSEEGMTDCQLYFPQATELDLSESFRTNHLCLQPDLKRVVPLHQLTTLVITCSRFSFEQLVHLLSATPNVLALTYACQSVGGSETKSIQQTDMFRSVARNNRITKVAATGMYFMSTMQTLVTLCPRVQYLTMEHHAKHTKASLQWILSRCETDLPSLCLICMQSATKSIEVVRETLIDTNDLPENYSVRQIGEDLYLWW